MSDFLIKRLLLLSTSEKKARLVRFHPKATVILGDNDTGKSSLLKSVLRCLGTEPQIHFNWKRANISSLLDFSVNGSDFSILRHGSQYCVFQGDGNLIESFDSVTNGLGLFLARLFNFGLKLMNRQNESVTPPPAYLFLPFYFDQDRSWTESWHGFERLEQMKSWKADLVEYHTGIKPNAFYELKGDQSSLTVQRDETQAELEMVRRIRNELNDKLQAISFTVDLDAFREEITEMLVECEKIQRTAEKIRERLVDLHNERMSIEAQIEIVKGSLKELTADYEFLRLKEDHVDCPTCGAAYENGFREVFDIALDEDRCEELLGRLNEELTSVKRKIAAESTMHDRHEADAAHVRALLAARKEEVQLKDLIESESKQQISSVLREKMDRLNAGAVAFQVKLNELNQKLKELTSKPRREAITQGFRASMREYLFALAVHGMPEQAYRNVAARITEQGSDLPRALLAYGFSILHVMRRHASSVFCPLVIDSPIQQEQDQENHVRILQFIRDNRPENSQLIMAVVDAKGVDFGGDVITLDRKRSVLGVEDYEQVHAELAPYIQKSLFSIQDGLGLQ